MTNEMVNALIGYFETLYDLNRDLIKLCGIDVIDNSGQYEKRAEEIIHGIPRLVPYAFNKRAQRYEIIASDGLLEFDGEAPYLAEAYEKLMDAHYDFLKRIKQIRNKHEHRMHGARLTSSESSTIGLFSLTYRLDDEEINFEADEFINFIKDVNLLFSKIQNEVRQFANKPARDNHPYIRRLIRFSFSKFNSIYESPVLRVIGQAMYPF